MVNLSTKKQNLPSTANPTLDSDNLQRGDMARRTDLKKLLFSSFSPARSGSLSEEVIIRELMLLHRPET